MRIENGGRRTLSAAFFGLFIISLAVWLALTAPARAAGTGGSLAPGSFGTTPAPGALGSALDPVQVQPPPGSTISNDGPGDDGYQLPAGAIGVHVQLPPEGAPMPSTLQSSAVYPSSSPTVSPAPTVTEASSFNCEYGANEPYSPSQGLMDGTSDMYCTGVTSDKIASTLWWWSGSNWHDVGHATATGPNANWIYAEAYDACTPGTQHKWHTEAQGDVYISGTTIGLKTANSPDETPVCAG
jgi:hypothetical protein